MPPRITRAQFRNYKSLADVSVDLEPLTVLVGPNGSGKSNFVDALAFVSDCLAVSIPLAVAHRGGTQAIWRKCGSGVQQRHIGVDLAIDLGGGQDASYALEIEARPDESFSVTREACSLRRPGSKAVAFEVRDGIFVTPIQGIRTRVSSDRLGLFVSSATEEFRPLYDFIMSMRAYCIAPGALQGGQHLWGNGGLKSDGGNAPAVLEQLEKESEPWRYERVRRLLAHIVPGLESVRTHLFDGKPRLEFTQRMEGQNTCTFEALSMSDGTLSVLGLLLAVYQLPGPSVLAIEEPEATVHPAAAELILEVLLDAARERQVIVTTHSPDILDAKDLADENIRAVVMSEGKTSITRLTPAIRKIIRDRLFTPGELLRSGELDADLPEAGAENRNSDIAKTSPEEGG